MSFSWGNATTATATASILGTHTPPSTGLPMDTQYLVKPPRWLKSLAIEQIAQWVTSEARRLQRGLRDVYTQNHYSSQAEASMHDQIEALWNFVECKVPKLFHDRLAIELVRALTEQEDRVINLRAKYMESNQSNSYLQFSKILFCDYFTTFVTKYAATSNIYFTAEVYSGIKRLVIDFSQSMWGQWHIDQTKEANIIQMLKSLPYLKYFTINVTCSDNILRCLVENCQQIEELNLPDSRYVTDGSIHILTQFSNLKVCDLTYTLVTKLGMANLLTSNGNIEQIIDLQSNTIAEAIEHIQISSTDAPLQFKLKSYANHYVTTYDQLKLVIQTCPQIQKLKIEKWESYGSIEFLKNLENLTELILKDFNFSTDKVKDILEARGSKLKHLRFKGIRQVSLKTLIDISRMCPNLQTLVINCFLEKEESQCQNNVVKMQPFKHLKTLVSHGFTSEEAFIFLLSNSPNIEFIRTANPLTDEIMLKVLHYNRLIHLVKFKMLRSDLSVAIIDRIVRNCIIPPVLINYTSCFIYDGYEF